MKINKLRFLSISIGAVLLFTTLAQAREGSEDLQAPYVTPQTVKAWQKAGTKIYFLDVRQKDEFAAGHLPNAVNVVYSEVALLAKKLPHNSPIVTYCIHSSHRAPMAAKILRELGFANAYVMEGGIVAWKAGGMMIRSNNFAQEPKILPLKERCAVVAKG